MMQVYRRFAKILFKLFDCTIDDSRSNFKYYEKYVYNYLYADDAIGKIILSK